MNSRRILAYGEDSLVIATRAMILRRAGYEVVHTTRMADLAPLLQGIFFDMILLGDSLRTQQNVLLAQRLRAQFPTLPIAMVQDEKDERDPWSTAFVNSNPEQMLNSVRIMLDESMRKPAVSDSGNRNLRAMRRAAGRC
jgi:CheY-like chemotaxis protein